jgi:hypothetical protein
MYIIIVRVVLHGRGTCPLALWKDAEDICTYEGEVIGGWRKQRNEEIYNFRSSQNIGNTMKSGRMERAKHSAQVHEIVNAYRGSVRTLKE